MGRCISYYMRNGKTYRRVVDSTPAAFLHRKYYITAQVFSYRVETIWPCIAFVSWCKGEDINKFLNRRIKHLKNRERTLVTAQTLSAEKQGGNASIKSAEKKTFFTREKVQMCQASGRKNGKCITTTFPRRY